MLTTRQTETLSLILNDVIPPSADGHVPGAGNAGVASFLQQATPYDPDPARVVLTVIETVLEIADDFSSQSPQDRIDVITRVEAQHPQIFERFLRLTYMGYYSQAELRPLFGVAAEPVHPSGYPVPPESPRMMADLTAPVRARGAVYRPADG